MGEIKLIGTGIGDLLSTAHLRAPGLHVSDVIHHLCLELGHYSEDGKTLSDKMTRFQLGHMLERAWIDRLLESEPSRYVRLEELCVDGMSGNPDLYDLQDSAVNEFKLTWMSTRHLDRSSGQPIASPESPKFWKYWTQIKAYCHMLGSDVGVLRVCFGDYKYTDSGEPEAYSWGYRFSKVELAQNWAMLKRHAERNRLG